MFRELGYIWVWLITCMQALWLLVVPCTGFPDFSQLVPSTNNALFLFARRANVKTFERFSDFVFLWHGAANYRTGWEMSLDFHMACYWISMRSHGIFSKFWAYFVMWFKMSFLFLKFCNTVFVVSILFKSVFKNI